MTEKVFVLDTNVLVHDPDAIFKFPRHEVVIPMTVVEELDHMKRSPGELGRHARKAIRLLESTKTMGEGDLHTGIRLPSGALIRILVEMKTNYGGSLALDVKDNQILMSAYFLFEQGRRVVFVSKDLAARVKASVLGIEAQDYENLKCSYEALAQGITKLDLEKSAIDHFYKDGSLEIPGIEARPNEYFILHSLEHSSAIARYDAKATRFESLGRISATWGIKPRNVEQKCAMDALLRDDLKLVTLMGPAGTGKTLLALACALRKVYDEGVYHKVLVSRPIVPLGRDIGYLPGTKEEKLSSWMQPIFDNLELLCSYLSREHTDTLQWVMDSKKIEMEAVTYIRGRSLPRMFIIIDEAQNLTPHELKTFISRAGDDTKVVLLGDPTQIDNPYLDKDSNGLTYAMGKFMHQPIAGSVYLDKTERSELASLAVELL